MPAPGDTVSHPLDALSFGGAAEAQRATDARDRMMARMQAASIPLTRFAPGSIKEERLSTLTGGDEAIIRADKHRLIKVAGPGAVMAALDDPLYRTVERALLPYTDIGSMGCKPSHRWRAAEHFRPFFAIPALVEAIAPLVKPLAGYTDAELVAEMERRK